MAVVMATPRLLGPLGASGRIAGRGRARGLQHAAIAAFVRRGGLAFAVAAAGLHFLYYLYSRTPPSHSIALPAPVGPARSGLRRLSRPVFKSRGISPEPLPEERAANERLEGGSGPARATMAVRARVVLQIALVDLPGCS